MTNQNCCLYRIILKIHANYLLQVIIKYRFELLTMFLKVTQNGTGWIRKFKEQKQNTGSYMSCNQYKVAHVINHLHPEFLFHSVAIFI